MPTFITIFVYLEANIVLVFGPVLSPIEVLVGPTFDRMTAMPFFPLNQLFK